MPQWDAGDAVNGNYGGSTIAVPAGRPSAGSRGVRALAQHGSRRPRWRSTGGRRTCSRSRPRRSTNPEWATSRPEFWVDRAHEVMARGRAPGRHRLRLEPVHPVRLHDLATECAAGEDRQETFVQAMQELQDTSRSTPRAGLHGRTAGVTATSSSADRGAVAPRGPRLPGRPGLSSGARLEAPDMTADASTSAARPAARAGEAPAAGRGPHAPEQRALPVPLAVHRALRHLPHLPAALALWLSLFRTSSSAGGPSSRSTTT